MIAERPDGGLDPVVLLGRYKLRWIIRNPGVARQADGLADPRDWEAALHR